MIKKCKECNISFMTPERRREFCSLSCSSIYNNHNRKGYKNITISCKTCGKNFTKIKSEYKKHSRKGFKNHFCSKICTHNHFKGEKREKTSKSLLKYRLTTKPSPCAFRKGGFREDLGIYVRSSWEANYARILNYNGIQWEYEPETFSVCLHGKNISYTPDFFLPEENRYIEIKGYWANQKAKEKYEAFQKKYNTELIEFPTYKKLEKQYGNFIQWEGRKYV